jgi:CBS-domain-containing membrane protein
MHIIDKSFIKAPKKYIIQSLIAVAAVALILFFVETLTHAAIVAALGASSFIVFAMPHSITAQPRRLIGGHIVGLACGTLCHYALFTGPLGELVGNWGYMLWLAAALAVGLSIFVLFFAIGLALIRRLLRGYLKDLF